MSIEQVDKRVEYLCGLADRSYNIPGRREQIQEEVDRLMDQRDKLQREQ